MFAGKARKRAGTLLGVAALLVLTALAYRHRNAAAGEARVPPPAAPSEPPVAAAAPVSAVASAAPTPVPAPADRSAAAGAAEKQRLERRAFQLEMENARLRGRLDDMINWILTNVKGTFPLPENQLAHLRLAPVDDDMAVSDDLARLLRLDEAEIGRLDGMFLDTRTVLRELESANISVDARAENQVVLSIPPYAEEGLVVREDLYGELKRTLGSARFARLLQVAEAGLEEKFDYFGLSDRTLEFEALRDAATGEVQLFVRDERILPGKDDPQRLDVVASERIVAELPEEYRAYWDWLPDYVTRFARND